MSSTTSTIMSLDRGYYSTGWLNRSMIKEKLNINWPSSEYSNVQIRHKEDQTDAKVAQVIRNYLNNNEDAQEADRAEGFRLYLTN